MHCPKCETRRLINHQVGGIEVDRCENCHGIWFDDDELERLLDFKKRDLRSLQSSTQQDELNQKHGKCPRDQSELLRVCSAVDPTLILDTCVNCNGVWLDGGELGRLISR